MALIDTLESAWYRGAPAPWWTAPLALLYGAVTRTRSLLFRRGVLRSVRLAAPVVVIGNLSVGGTGKTPLTIAVVEALRERGHRPGVVSRGHGGTQREPLLLGAAPDPARVGDEPCLIHASGVPVAIGRDRPAAAQLLLDAGCDVVLADDGLQHYRLARDVEICVIDGVRRFGNRRLLPAGPLREPLTRLQRVDLRVCNGGVAEPGEYPMQLHGGDVVALADGRRQSLATFRGQRVHAVAAIGNPQRFFDSLRDAGIEVIGHPFADHHAFVPGDLAFGDQLPLLMTDKDAVKCAGFARPDWFRVPVRAQLPLAFFDALTARVEAALRRH
ncbi:tetraacyldisaccharide 4'-kinase [Rhodanobacter spathiphylli]|uniref:Tetraacyldisaccharide 4'-kinase n=1 Tax=Rhodanobacter spathiphylli B39 TaxID=1163407 RepID=I4W024_9GAMM|nr:tetraacyldisaccharide 4'-kinase [Rhodanobacter spathiphylli]EIL92815.1 tetraacyldisaccharide 4'-kinase [Rhodanobacter spathiphylli B39]